MATRRKGKAVADGAQQRRAAAVRESARARLQYERLSLQWCEKLFAPVGEATLREAARYLTPADYDGVVAERAADDLCGYPLCARKARPVDARYHISLAKRKVLDVSEQASYCSSQCMVGSRFYRLQLPEDPIYMRRRDGALDIDIVPLAAEPAAAPTEDTDLMGWYRASLAGKMKIPDAVAASSPLKIVEHDTSSAAASTSNDAIAQLSYAEIEGFKPEKDTQHIKKAVRKVNAAAAAAKGAAKPVPEKGSRPANVASTAGDSADAVDVTRDAASTAKAPIDDDDGVLQLGVGGKASNVNQLLGMLSLSDGDDDDDDDNGSDDEIDSDTGHFAKLFGGGGSRSSGPRLSLFGRMWTLVDTIATRCTMAFLRDLKQAGSAAGLQGRAVDYYASPGDQAMAKRHELFVGPMARALDELRRSLRVGTPLELEMRMLASTLELRSNMVMFSPGERQLLAAVFLLALARSMPPLAQEVAAASAELGAVLGGLGSDRSRLDMMAGRLHEPY